MAAPGAPIESPDYPFAFRLLAPVPEAPSALVVALHGVGGDELQLVGLASRLPPGAAVALPRGTRTISGERLGWFRVGLGGDVPHVVEDEAEEARTRLLAFIGALQQRFEVPASRTFLCGFSQGGVLAATVALTAPASVGGFAMVSGRLLPEYRGRIAARPELAHLRALLVHGEADDVLPVDGAREAHVTLEQLGIASRLEVHAAGHELAPGMEDDVVQWLAALLARD